MSEISGNAIYERLTPQRKQLVDEVLKNLENGTGLWRQGWRTCGAPVSGITGKRYSGVNRLFLTAATMAKGYSDNRWITYKQMTDKGWSFKRSEEGESLGKNAGVAIEYFELRDKETNLPFDRHSLDGMTADEKNSYMDENVFPIRKYYRVFNGDIIEGIPERERPPYDESGYNERAEKILKIWSETEAPIIYGGGAAYYIPDKDEIHVPEREAFVDMREFYSTTLHEVGHSTGHERRLNRNLSGKFGTPEYAEEELRAEIASMFLAQDLEIDSTESHIQNNSAYIQAWKAKITENPNVLFTAIADAERITKFVMAKEMQSEETEEETKEEAEREHSEKMERLSKVEEEKSSVFMPPSEAAAQADNSVTFVDMTDRGIDSLTDMDDREVVERGGRTKYGEKFMSLFNGERFSDSEEKDERSLMARIAMLSNGTEQTMRIFRASGQYREEKPVSYYERMAREETKFVDGLRNKVVLPQTAEHSGNGSRFSNAKS